MQVHLSEQMQQFVQQHVDIGLYTDTAEVIRDALRQLMREQPPLPATDFARAVAVGIAQIEQGQTVPWNAAMRRKIKAPAQQKHLHHEPLNPDVWAS
ncbi:MAG: type II toxin-antitoxin system ParD family antitoxin [Holosporales bacterium]